MPDRREVLTAGGALALSAGFTPVARAQKLDSAMILVGFVPGGLTDIIARRVADKMRGDFATNVLVENKPGASGQIAVTQVKDAPADGSMLLLTHSSSLAMYPFTFKKLPYDPDKDLQPVSLVCYTNHALCVGPAVPDSVKDVKGLLAWAKAHPEHANYGCPAWARCRI